MQKPIALSIDTVNNSSVISYDNIRKGDTLQMTIKIFQNSGNLDLTGQKMHVVLNKPDGYSVEKIIQSVTGNQFIVNFDLQATLAVGYVVGIIEISNSNGTNITNDFTFEVKENPASNIIIQSSNQIETLQQIEALIATYNANADNLAVQNQLAIQNKADLTNLNSTAGNLADRLEIDISTGTGVAIRLEDDIAKGNQLDSNLKQDITQGTTLHNVLLVDITNGNNVADYLKTLNFEYIKSMFNLVEKLLDNARLTDESDNYLTDENGNYLTM
ncbi:BppU family phage baseplate upper protein [Clostridium saccharoperbutylacetonicum]|uniref:BppU family phage baseplate upper protein n=1 Tax=Clostridium saccharoperbutylacetonicum TaxID=36745 RepID=UPI0039EA43F6